jgi:hypothetical protein
MHLAADLAGLVCRLRGWDFDEYFAYEAAMADEHGHRIVDSLVIDLRFAIEDISLPRGYVRSGQRRSIAGRGGCRPRTLRAPTGRSGA